MDNRLVDAGGQSLTSRLGAHESSVAQSLAEMERSDVVGRIWSRDHRLWKPQPVEIANRLGWLHIVGKMKASLPQIFEFVDNVRSDGYNRALLLGMGGSSLAPEVFRKTFGVQSGYLDLAVLDSTDPETILDLASEIDLARTLFIVSTKSGTTIETLSLFKYFYNRVSEAFGLSEAGQHFIAITDAGTPLESIARAYAFRAAFLNDPDIGGRYAALSYVGLVPAGLMGLELEGNLDRTQRIVQNCRMAGSENLGACLGAMLGELALAGKDKLTLVCSPSVASFGDWVEQLIAESTGKEGKGIFPVVSEEPGPPEVYADDRLIVYLQLKGEADQESFVRALEDAGQPVVRLRLEELADLGGQFFLWEMATAVAGHLLAINPFDQPDVEAAKVFARQAVAAYEHEGRLPETGAPLRIEGISIDANPGWSSPVPPSGGDLVEGFLGQANPGDYLALQAFIQPTPEVEALLRALRRNLCARTKLATSLGYGPRFLHSTGQLHKGDRGNGLFIQITADPDRDIPIPDEAGAPRSTITFGALKLAQAFGDRQALRAARRRVISLHLGRDILGGLQKIAGWVVG
jgi:glucose-6-phosphate isomerase